MTESTPAPNTSPNTAKTPTPNIPPVTAPKDAEAKRDELRAKIEAAEARNESRSFGEYAKEAQETATNFVKERPLTTIAGIAIAGLVIGSLFPKGRQVGRNVGTRAASLATLAAEFSALYGAIALDTVSDAARAGQDRLEDIGESAGKGARGLKRDAGYYADSAGDNVRTATRRAGRKTSRTIRDLRSRIRG